jgi:hypothetical protein
MSRPPGPYLSCRLPAAPHHSRIQLISKRIATNHQTPSRDTTQVHVLRLPRIHLMARETPRHSRFNPDDRSNKRAMADINVHDAKGWIYSVLLRVATAAATSRRSHMLGEPIQDAEPARKGSESAMRGSQNARIASDCAWNACIRCRREILQRANSGWIDFI